MLVDLAAMVKVINGGSGGGRPKGGDGGGVRGEGGVAVS